MATNKDDQEQQMKPKRKNIKVFKDGRVRMGAISPFLDFVSSSEKCSKRITKVVVESGRIIKMTVENTVKIEDVDYCFSDGEKPGGFTGTFCFDNDYESPLTKSSLGIKAVGFYSVKRKLKKGGETER